MDRQLDSPPSGEAGTASIEPSDAAVVAATKKGWRSRLPDALAIAALIALVPVVHNVPAMLRLPYWLDEAWVALPRRFPLSDLPDLVSVTPVVYALLIRLIPNPDALRLITLFFLAGSVVAGYGLGRALGWASRVQGIIAGCAMALAVLLLPAQQLRHDLKSYTADAAVALIVLVLLAALERHWSRRRLVALVAVIGAGMLVSHTTAVVAVCALGGLCLVPLARRQWTRLIEAVTTSVAGGVVVAAIYLGISRRGQRDSLEDYWSGFYPSPGGLPAYVLGRLRLLEPYLGLPWQLFVLLAIVGLVALFRLGRPTVALAAGLLPVALTGLGLAKVYPLLDLRTSHFLLVVSAALGGLGLSWLALAAGRFLARFTAPISAESIAAATTAIAIGAATLANAAWLRFDGEEPALKLRVPMAADDVRTSTRYIQDHRAPGDIVMVNTLGAFGFAYYWTADAPGYRIAPDMATGWVVDYPRSSGIVIVYYRTADAIRAALAEASERAAERGPGTRIWVLQSHVKASERRLWQAAYEPSQAAGTLTIEKIRVGAEEILILTPTGSGPAG